MIQPVSSTQTNFKGHFRLGKTKRDKEKIVCNMSKLAKPQQAKSIQKNINELIDILDFVTPESTTGYINAGAKSYKNGKYGVILTANMDKNCLDENKDALLGFGYTNKMHNLDNAVYEASNNVIANSLKNILKNKKQ